MITSNYIEVEPNTNYKASYTLCNSEKKQICTYEYDENETYLGFSFSSELIHKFKTKSNTKYLKVRYRDSSQNINAYLSKDVKKIHTKNDNGVYEEFYNEEEPKSKILWTNPNPTSTFAPQNITFNSDDYDVLEWVFCANMSNTESTWAKCRKRDSVLLQTVAGLETITIRTRLCTKVSTLEYSISDARSFTGLNATGTVDNSRCIPLYVIGHKTGLF